MTPPCSHSSSLRENPIFSGSVWWMSLEHQRDFHCNWGKAIPIGEWRILRYLPGFGSFCKQSLGWWPMNSTVFVRRCPCMWRPRWGIYHFRWGNKLCRLAVRRPHRSRPIGFKMAGKPAESETRLTMSFSAAWRGSRPEAHAAGRVDGDQIRRRPSATTTVLRT